MPRRGWNDWYFPALILGLALTAFFLGSATTIWLGTVSLSPTPRGAAVVQGAASGPNGNQTIGPADRPPAADQSPAAQAPGPAQPAAAAVAAQSTPVAAVSAAVPASAPGTTNPAASQAEGYSLQLGAFLDATKAKSVAELLAARGFTPTAIDAADGFGRTWHYVRLGGYRDEDAAARASNQLARAGIGTAVVRPAAAHAER
jgi:cell division protein FtsN